MRKRLRLPRRGLAIRRWFNECEAPLALVAGRNPDPMNLEDFRKHQQHKVHHLGDDILRKPSEKCDVEAFGFRADSGNANN